METGHGLSAGHTPSRTGDAGASGVGAAEGGQELSNGVADYDRMTVPRGGMPSAATVPGSGSRPSSPGCRSVETTPSTPSSN